MSQARRLPPTERIIQNQAGLFFKDGFWTASAQDATVFATVTEALRARQIFGLENVHLVRPPEPPTRPPYLSN